jgi:hypothetical protein
MARQLWLPDVLRDAGLTVHEVDGWKTRSGQEDADASTFDPRGLIIHETRSVGIASDGDEIDVLVNGREGLSGPIAQLYLGRNGHWHVVAAGLCHHVKVGFAGPFEDRGNSRLLGVEAAHTVSVNAAGRRLEVWDDKPVQFESYLRGAAAILNHTGWPPPVGHKEHQPGDKSDPDFDMDSFRADVVRVMAGEDDFMTPEEVAAGVVLGMHSALGQAARRDTPTGRQLGDFIATLLSTVRDPVLERLNALPAKLDAILAAAKDDGRVDVRLPQDMQRTLESIRDELAKLQAEP